MEVAGKAAVELETGEREGGRGRGRERGRERVEDRGTRKVVDYPLREVKSGTRFAYVILAGGKKLNWLDVVC